MRWIAAAALFFFVQSCARKQFSAVNSTYDEKSKLFAAVIHSMPRDSVRADSLKRPSSETLTTNFGMRKPGMVIIHYTAQNNCAQTLETFSNPAKEVSAHYVICKDGTLHHMLNDYLRAWHAGVSKWGGNSDINSSSIGVEIDNNGLDTFSAAQMNVLSGLLAFLKKSYNIPTANFIGHSDVAPGRKVDPGALFPWKDLADKGFGLWYSDTAKAKLPADFNTALALRLIGYDIADLPAAIISFRLHFLASDKGGELSEAEKKVLYSVMLKYL